MTRHTVRPQLAPVEPDPDLSAMTCDGCGVPGVHLVCPGDLGGAPMRGWCSMDCAAEAELPKLASEQVATS